MFCIILGTRPEIIKFSPIIKRLKDCFVIHTGQHYSTNMDKVFFEGLNLPEPEYNLNSTHISNMITGISSILSQRKPDKVLVLGDTNSTLAGTLAANRLKIPLVHLEAGLRSYDIVMAEEVNRMLADHLSDILFTPTETANQNLLHEKVRGEICVFGNTIVDVVDTFSGVTEDPGDYALVTIHRAENVDIESRLRSILSALDKLDIFAYFPVHPRTSKQMNIFSLNTRVKTIPPLSYFKMIQLLRFAKVVITDSGGLQEEACILGVPCVTVRDTTERPETVKLGANILVGTQTDNILSGVRKMIQSPRNWKHPYGENVSEKICQKLAS